MQKSLIIIYAKPIQLHIGESQKHKNQQTTQRDIVAHKKWMNNNEQTR